MSKNKGARYERELVNELQNAGYFARRAGSSGSGTDAESYDVIAAKDGSVYVIELKFVSSGRAYVDHEKVHGESDEAGHDGLLGVARQFGATPLVVARFSGDTTFHAFTPSACETTSSGNYVIAKDHRENAMVLP